MSPASCRCAGGGRPGARFAQGLAHRHRGPDAVAALRSDPEEARRIGREAADQVRVGRRIVIVVACSMWWMPSAMSRSSGCPLCGWVGSAARTGASNRASAPGSAAPRRPAWRPGRPRRLRCQAAVVHVSAVRRRSPSSPDLARDRGDGPLQVQGAVAPPRLTAPSWRGPANSASAPARSSLWLRSTGPVMPDPDPGGSEAGASGPIRRRKSIRRRETCYTTHMMGTWLALFFGSIQNDSFMKRPKISRGRMEVRSIGSTLGRTVCRPGIPTRASNSSAA